MSVVAELWLDSSDFELGRFLDTDGARVELETVVPVGEQYVPSIWVYHGNGGGDGRPTAGSDDHPLAEGFRRIDEFEDRSLYALRWRGDEDQFLATVDGHEAQLLTAVGAGDTWEMELRFASHEALSSFRADCEAADIDPDVRRIYNPTKPDRGTRFGLTEHQREALLLAARTGYYDIPRETSTEDLADQLGISDQAVTERLRRAIRTLVEHTLLPPVEE